MMRVITANLNGIRSAAKKGFFDWLGEQNADCVCVQEIKVSADDLPAEFVAPHGLKSYFHHAAKKGYSGAGLYSRREPDDVIIGFGSSEFDPEGVTSRRATANCRSCRCTCRPARAATSASRRSTASWTNSCRISRS